MCCWLSHVWSAADTEWRWIAAMIHRSGSQQSPILKVSQESLAQQLGVSRQSVNRQLKLWESEGLLTLQYRAIVIVDLQKLENATREH
jgi:CRP/FNR family cyclic AMP-dependent transcriptional regulator